MFSNIKYLYAVDALRADGYPVRLARLGMLTPHVSPVWLLCWVMECTFVCAFFARRKTVPILGFWLAYLAIVAMV